jgi:hypothetical protein
MNALTPFARGRGKYLYVLLSWIWLKPTIGWVDLSGENDVETWFCPTVGESNYEMPHDGQIFSKAKWRFVRAFLPYERPEAGGPNLTLSIFILRGGFFCSVEGSPNGK